MCECIYLFVVQQRCFIIIIIIIIRGVGIGPIGAKLRWAWGAKRHVMCVNKPKKTSAQSTRAHGASKTYQSCNFILLKDPKLKTSYNKPYFFSSRYSSRGGVGGDAELRQTST